MNPSDEFLRHATECQKMAKSARYRGDKDVWNRMAERWLRLASWFEEETAKAKAVTKPKRQRKASLQWAHHSGQQSMG
jgi:hypothetical protein